MSPNERSQDYMGLEPLIADYLESAQRYGLPDEENRGGGGEAVGREWGEMLVSRRMKDEHNSRYIAQCHAYQRVQYVCGESAVIYLQGSGDAWFGEFGKAPGPQWAQNTFKSKERKNQDVQFPYTEEKLTDVESRIREFCKTNLWLVIH